MLIRYASKSREGARQKIRQRKMPRYPACALGVSRQKQTRKEREEEGTSMAEIAQDGRYLSPLPWMLWWTCTPVSAHAEENVRDKQTKYKQRKEQRKERGGRHAEATVWQMLQRWQSSLNRHWRNRELQQS